MLSAMTRAPNLLPERITPSDHRVLSAVEEYDRELGNTSLPRTLEYAFHCLIKQAARVYNDVTDEQATADSNPTDQNPTQGVTFPWASIIIIWLVRLVYVMIILTLIYRQVKKPNAANLIDFTKIPAANLERKLMDLDEHDKKSVLSAYLWETVLKSNRIDLIHSLVSMGADVNETYQNEMTLLMCACASNSNAEVISTLIDLSNNINQSDAMGLTALMYAAAENSLAEAVQLLINRGADIGICDHMGMDALMHACQKSHYPEVVEILLNNGANPKVLDKKVKNALSYAIKNPDLKNSPIVRYLDR